MRVQPVIRFHTAGCSYMHERRSALYNNIAYVNLLCFVWAASTWQHELRSGGQSPPNVRLVSLVAWNYLCKFTVLCWLGALRANFHSINYNVDNGNFLSKWNQVRNRYLRAVWRRCLCRTMHEDMVLYLSITKQKQTGITQTATVQVHGKSADLIIFNWNAEIIIMRRLHAIKLCNNSTEYHIYSRF